MNSTRPCRGTHPFVAISAGYFAQTITLACVFASPPPKISWEAAGMDPAMESRIEHVVARAIDDHKMPGCVVLVGRRAGIVFQHAYGHRSLEPEKAPMTTDTVFDMASLTKPIATG